MQRTVLVNFPHRLLLCLVLLAPFMGLATHTVLSDTRTAIHDGFEHETLSAIWSDQRIEAHAFEVQSQIVRSGQHAAKITLRSGDKANPGNDLDLPNERDELQEVKTLHAQEEDTFEYRFSVYLPDDFPLVPTRLVLAQWKQNCPRGTACNTFSPVIALRYQNGKMFLTLQTDANRTTLWQTTKDLRAQWLDFRFTIRFSRFDHGIVQVYLNDKAIVQYQGKTSYIDKHYDTNTYYFKIGLYRDQMPEPMVIYIDDYSKVTVDEAPLKRQH